MNKIYKNVDDYFKENFPKSYLDFKNDDRTPIQRDIDALSERFDKAVREIIAGTHSKSHNNEPGHASTP